jgi:hypothetical protein
MSVGRAEPALPRHSPRLRTDPRPAYPFGAHGDLVIMADNCSWPRREVETAGLASCHLAEHASERRSRYVSVVG